jgi:LysM repeat protein
MKPVFHSFFLVTILFVLNGCRTTAPPSDNVGPFDANGNYVEAWADDPSKWRSYKPKDVENDPPMIAKNEQPPDHSVPLVTGDSTEPRSLPTKPVTSSPRPTPSTSQVTSRSTTKPRTSITSNKAKPKPTVAKAKPKAKPKPSVVRHTVKKGDSLSSLASKYGSSVSAIKSANGISGTLIRPGQSLTIPKK